MRDVTMVGRAKMLPIDVALVLYEFPEVSTPSAEYQIVRPKRAGARAARAMRARAGRRRAGARRASSASAFTAAHGIATRLELVERGEVPRFAYKAARVVDA